MCRQIRKARFNLKTRKIVMLMRKAKKPSIICAKRHGGQWYEMRLGKQAGSSHIKAVPQPAHLILIQWNSELG